MVLSLLPQPASGAATASAHRRGTRRRRELIAAARLAKARDRRPPPAALALLEDRAQAAQRLGALALEPAARPEGLHQTVGERRGPRLDGQRDAGRAARAGLELVDAA